MVCNFVDILRRRSEFTNFFLDLLQDAVLCNNQVNAYIAAIGYEGAYEADPDHRMNVPTTYTLYNMYKDAAVSSGQMLLPLFKDSLTIYNFCAGIWEKYK